MGTRHFYPTEQKHSRIKWEIADAETARSLAAAIQKYSYGLVNAKVARVVVFTPGVLLLVILVGFLSLLIRNYSRIVGSIEIYFYIFYLVAIVFFAVFLLVRYIKFRPYLYPERQPCIRIFRAKCASLSTRGMRRNDYYANFQKGGGHICIRIEWHEYDANPTGKEYIFYKFNDRTGNRWTAIASDKLSEAT